MELGGKRVLVVGLGKTGFAAARVLAGLDAKVRVTEARSDEHLRPQADALASLGVEVELGGHDLDAMDVDLAILSPGIPPRAPIVSALATRGVETISEIELAARFARCDLIAVTGTNGKTTTTSLIAAILAEAGIPSAAAGNIGTPLIELVSQIDEGGAIAVEVSSFQLATISEFRPRIAVLLNVAEDHMDWHATFEDYAAAKARIAENQTPEDVFVFNADDPIAERIANTSRSRTIGFSSTRILRQGVGLLGDRIVVDGEPFMDRADIALIGTGGLQDAMAAIAATTAYGIDEHAVVRALKGFRPLAHRLEIVATTAGVTFIDDSKATNPHATLAAVKGLSDVVLIAGGRSKGIDLAPLVDAVPPVRAVVALGEARREIERVFAGRVPVIVADDMLTAVRAARDLAVPGGSVLLSPGCASLDMYEDYVARGEDFARAVRLVISGEDDGNT